jgi:hypothetical protein
MTRSIPLVVVVCLPAWMLGQVALEHDDLPSVGSSYSLHVDKDPVTGLSITPASDEAQFWDFAPLLEPERDNDFLMVAPEFVQGVADHPGATHATVRTRHIGDYTAIKGQFFKAEPYGLFYIGHTTTFDTVADLEAEYEDWLVVPAPFTFGTTLHIEGDIVEVMVHHPDFNLPAEKKVRKRSRDYLSDAFGTMTTPAYPAGVEVIRVKEYNAVSIDSLYLNYDGDADGPWQLVEVDTIEHNLRYAFYKVGDPCLVVSMGMEPNDTVVARAKYVSVGPEPYIPVNDPDGGLFLHPNPIASGQMLATLADGKAERVAVHDAQGRLVDGFTLAAARQFLYSPLHLANGSYRLTCFSGKDKPIATGTFVVAQ